MCYLNVLPSMQQTTPTQGFESQTKDIFVDESKLMHEKQAEIKYSLGGSLSGTPS